MFTYLYSFRAQELCQSKSRWPSWAPVPNKPTVSVNVKQHFNNNNNNNRLIILFLQVLIYYMMSTVDPIKTCC